MELSKRSGATTSEFFCGFEPEPIAPSTRSRNLITQTVSTVKLMSALLTKHQFVVEANL